MFPRRRFLASALSFMGMLPLWSRAQTAPAARLVLLGTKGGPSVRDVAQIPTSHALLVGEDVHVVDAGYGVTYRLTEKKIPLTAIRAVYVTHHHSDHNLELGTLLYNAWANSLAKPIDVYGPEGIEPLIRASLESNRFDIDTRIADEGRPDLRKMVRTRTYHAGLVMENDSVRVTALRNLHPPIAESYALRFDIKGGRSVVFSGDTAYFEPLAEFARDCDYLVHEAMYGPALDRIVQINPSARTLMSHLRDSHTLVEDVGRIAAKAGARNLVLSHLVPGGGMTVRDEEWLRGAREHYRGNVIVARDLLEIDLR